MNARVLGLAVIAAVAVIAMLGALSGTQATAQARRPSAAPSWACTGDRCYAPASMCEERRAALRADGRRAPPCRRRSSVWCVWATQHFEWPPSEVLWCAPTRASCDEKVRKLDGDNERMVARGRMPVWQGISGCVPVGSRALVGPGDKVRDAGAPGAESAQDQVP